MSLYITDEQGVLYKIAGSSGGSSDIIVDDVLDLKSTNPVQNKVIAETLNNKVDIIEGKSLTTNDYDNDEKNKVSDNTTARHTHANKTILDNITASYTTEDKIALDNKADKTMLSNPNLLINGDFRVNQRGKEVYTTTKDRIYTADRWRLSANNETNLTFDLSTMTLSNTGSSVGYLVQMIENPDYLWGKTITISAKVDGVIKSLTLTLPSKPSSSGGVSSQLTLVSGKCNLRLFYYSGSTNAIGFTFDIFANSSVTLEYAKLEIGSVATALSPRPYAEELAMCQRYCFVIKKTSRFRAEYYFSNSFTFNIAVPTSLREIYTLTTTSNIANFVLKTINNQSVDTNFTFSTFDNATGNIAIRATSVASHNMTDAMIEANDNIIIDAEIY